MTQGDFRLDRDGALAILTLDRPGKRKRAGRLKTLVQLEHLGRRLARQ